MTHAMGNGESNDATKTVVADRDGMDASKSVKRKFMKAWNVWLMLNAALVTFFLYALLAPASSVKSAFLPGESSHGHYQIELSCNACHSPENDPNDHSSANVMQNACIHCHGEQLDAARDTHPAKKFNDPVNAELLEVLDAQNCLTCHREHVPEQTLEMGLTIPADYCWHCHDDVAESRPSHEGMAFQSCATAGCHNYHDNRALYEKFLNDHYGEADLLDSPRLPALTRFGGDKEVVALSVAMHDGPKQSATEKVLTEWSTTAHAKSGVNCTDCHQVPADDATAQGPWSDEVSLASCSKCHNDEASSFQTGMHGMRIAAGLSPMGPQFVRNTHQFTDSHKTLDCSACHSGHRFDTSYAAVEACLQCHNDQHSLAYRDSTHFSLWTAERDGEAEQGTGVSCAGCHLPRIENAEGQVWVQHDQNAVLRPNETMARQVCGHCHGLDFSLSALANPESVERNFSLPPTTRTESVQMAHDWFESKKRRKK